jgi:hypothetical protein
MPRSHAFFRWVAAAVLMANVAFVAPLQADPKGPKKPKARISRVYVKAKPPVTLVEVRPVAPGTEYVWMPGYQRWNGRTYQWVPGRWGRTPHGRSQFTPAGWRRDARGWYFVEGSWR